MNLELALERIESKINATHYRLETIETKVDELKQEKLDVVVHTADAKVFELEIGTLISSVEKITGYAKWGTLIVIGSVIAALMKLVLIP
jgi:methyl coenzyme M reductase subunit D